MLRELLFRLRRFSIEHGPELALAIFFVIFMLVFFAPNIFVSIQPGYYGVLWRRFGGGVDLTHTYGEGLHIVLPWNKMYLYDGRLQMQDRDFNVLSSDGLNMQVELAYRFELNPAEIPALARYIGEDYATTLVSPEVGARARDVFSLNTPEEIFSERRADIERTITDEVQHHLDVAFNPPWRGKQEVHFVKVWDVLIRGITLPPAVEAAIEAKNQAKQENEAYDYRLLAAAKEAERKQIEAHGIKEFQDIVSPGLTDNYLRWSGIQATMDLAKSPNSKVVVIGSGKGGMPIILGGLDDQKVPDPGAQPAASAVLPSMASPPPVHSEAGPANAGRSATSDAPVANPPAPQQPAPLGAPNAQP
ncbi:MAG TPA: SPFH domain-containing protein [Acetobacteraceae bacterium]|jgi:prohibitin 1|nr:SPFH domain-containing protein [Acetobacteraceae bacterium]